jgi:hypothetical protein
MLGFKNSSILVKPVRDKDILVSGESNETADPFVGPRVAAAYAEVAKDFVSHTALTVGAVFVTCKIVERLMR